MRDFEQLREEGRIETVSEDRAKTRGLLKRAVRRFENQKEREIDDKNAFEILENTYEALREVIEAGLAAEGFGSEDHVASIAYAEERLGVSDAEVNRLHRFRKLRNESRYEARDITKKEAEQIIEAADEMIYDLKGLVEEKI